MRVHKRMMLELRGQQCLATCCARPALAAMRADRACAELGKLRQLKQLNVSQNRCLGDAGLRLLAAALGGGVQELNLSYTSVSDASVSALAGMQVGRGPRAASGRRACVLLRSVALCCMQSRVPVASVRWRCQALTIPRALLRAPAARAGAAGGGAVGDERERRRRVAPAAAAPQADGQGHLPQVNKLLLTPPAAAA